MWSFASLPRRSLVAAALALLGLALFLPVLGNDFVALDDGPYVTDNPRVRDGLSRAGAVWAFTSAGYQGNWHPLTWLSHMLDAQLFGLDPRGHHATNLLLHAANTVLLFLLLHRLTGALGPSAAVAALFCVHPAHVETVAWIADRKGLLSTLFWLLATGAWLGHLRAPAPRRYLAALLLFAAGLLAKPMLVTLPLTLLLLDFWPLGRRFRAGILLEKAPFFALAAASAAVTYIAQLRGEAVSFTGLQHGWVRAANAVVSWAAYLDKLVRPVNLSVLYPFPEGYHPAGRIAASAALLLVLTAAAAFLRRRAPALAAGWGWYLVTTLPVIGLVQVGSQSMADRYTYVPFIGLFAALAWGVPALLPPALRRGPLPALAAVAALAALVPLAGAQIGRWRDSETLLAQALAVAPRNWLLHTNLGTWLLDRGRVDEAAGHFEAALRDNPADRLAAYNLGMARGRQGRVREAEAALRRAVRIDPGFSEGWNNLGAVLGRAGRLGEAVDCFAEAARLDPANRAARDNLAYARRLLGPRP